MNKDLKTYAKMNHVPIISDGGLIFLKQVIEDYNVKDVLEIGSAIGYSALSMAFFGCRVDTIERDLEMIEKAKENIRTYDLNKRVSLIEGDALLIEIPNKTYDLIFIDAAKAQYEKFFEKYQTYLKPNGVIVCDNLHFHHLNKAEVSRHTRQLISKIERFKVFLQSNEDFITTMHDIGDGMSISRRKR